jgi:hypothetical protein
MNRIFLASSPTAACRQITLLLLFTFVLVSGSGCHLCRKKHLWEPPTPAGESYQSYKITDISQLFFNDDWPEVAVDPSTELFKCMEESYRVARNSKSSQQAVDAYYQSLVRSWIFISRYRNFIYLDNQNYRAWDIYHSSLVEVISNGQKSGRLDLQKGLLVQTPVGMEWIPIRFNQFAWPEDSFNELVPVGFYYDKNLRHQFVECGLGCPVVAIRKNRCHDAPANTYFLKQTPFAATAILCPNTQPWLGTVSEQSQNLNEVGLILYNPLKVSNVQYSNVNYRLAADITSPLGALGQQTNWNPVEEYIRPETDPNLAGLRMLEPYQPQKTPILFVHGLFSDPQTYLEMANQIRAQADLNEKYQIWVYRYPTGGNFFLSAAHLRQQLESLIAECSVKNPENHLDSMVIIGHSLGGLMAKLQVSSSGTTLWDSVARVPFNQIVATPEQRQSLSSQFFFAASPNIKTAIFIATPNEGSPWAKRPAGKVASKMVKYSRNQTQLHRELIAQNPNIFSTTMQRRSPTSIDLMHPDNELLHAIQHLPLAPWVRSYAIAGTGGTVYSRMGPSDGVITIESATTPSACRTFYVDAIHTDILRHDTTINIVSQILRSHVDRLQKVPVHE